MRTANLIFAEHQKYSKQIPLLEEQIFNLEEINLSWQRTDSIRQLELYKCDLQIEEQTESIEKLRNSLKVKTDIIKYGAIFSIITTVCLLMK